MNHPDRSEYTQVSTSDRFSDFLSMTTHDLLAPLRKIGVLADKLVQKMGTDEEVSEYVRRIHSCVSEMRSIVTAARLIAESTPDSLEPEKVSTKDLVKDIIRELQAEKGGINAEIKIGDMPVIEGDRKQLGHMFRELMANSFVFSKKEVPLRIEWTAARLNDAERKSRELPGVEYWKFEMCDNGIGFDESDSEKIFEPTVRLHGKSAFPGNGLGLTLVKKIVENHKGMISAECGEEEGSRFLIILPQTLS